MSVEEFIKKLVCVYGDFYTEGMAKEVAMLVSSIAPQQRKKLMDVYLRHVPGNFRPDVKNLAYCIELAQLDSSRKEKVCRACGYKWDFSQPFCPKCGFELNSTEDPAAYRHEWETQSGRFCAEDIEKILGSLRFRGVR